MPMWCFSDRLTYGGFHNEWGYPNSWMVYNGKSDKNGWFGGTSILGNPISPWNQSCWEKPRPARIQFCHTLAKGVDRWLVQIQEETVEVIEVFESQYLIRSHKRKQWLTCWFPSFHLLCMLSDLSKALNESFKAFSSSWQESAEEKHLWAASAWRGEWIGAGHQVRRMKAIWL